LATKSVWLVPGGPSMKNTGTISMLPRAFTKLTILGPYCRRSLPYNKDYSGSFPWWVNVQLYVERSQ